MTTLAANTPRDREIGDTGSYPIIASDIIYDGAAVGDNGSGYARPLVAGDPFLGFCYSQCDNSAGAAGAKYVDVWKRGAVKLSVSGAVITDVGRPVYATDDNTFVLAGPTASTFIGRIVRFVSAGVVIVEFDAAGMKEELVDVQVRYNCAAVDGADGDLLTTWTPGYAGRIMKMYYVGVSSATAAAGGTINLEIGTTDLTGGVLTLASSHIVNALVTTATAITAGNAFTATDTISVELASGTTLATGSGDIHIILGH